MARMRRRPVFTAAGADGLTKRLERRPRRLRRAIGGCSCTNTPHRHALASS
jgi:hypothetical protein